MASQEGAGPRAGERLDHPAGLGGHQGLTQRVQHRRMIAAGLGQRTEQRGNGCQVTGVEDVPGERARAGIPGLSRQAIRNGADPASPDFLNFHEGSQPLVVDWRAPAAAAFYRATAAEPLGVVRRRMIQSSRERVTGIEDDLLDPDAAPPGMKIVGDGALLASLSKATGHGMRDIVATIQREQDDAIRSPASGVTIVTGGPGTGKTAVALHRAAYLLYSDRSRFAGGGILVVGPSGVFVDYIATVLPSLGEETATLRSLGSLVAGYDAVRTDPTAVAALKGSLRMRRVLERASHDAVPGAPTELRLLYRGALLRLDAADLERIRRKALPRGARRNEVRGTGFDRLFDALWVQAKGSVRNLPEKPEFESELADRTDFRDFLRAWWPRFTPMRVLRWLAEPARLRGYANGLLSREEIALLQGSFDDLAEHGPTIADVALLDELDELMGRPRQPQQRRRNNPFHVRDGVQEVSTFADRQAMTRAQIVRDDDYRDYAHVVVDEAQDVTPMQWRMIGRRGAYASWTIVGDPAQTAWSGDPEELDRARDRALGSRRRSVEGSSPSGSELKSFSFRYRLRALDALWRTCQIAEPSNITTSPPVSAARLVGAAALLNNGAVDSSDSASRWSAHGEAQTDRGPTEIEPRADNFVRRVHG